MARTNVFTVAALAGFPHPRGDGPPVRLVVVAVVMISPPAWGWPVGGNPVDPFTQDFPTRVGMARLRSPT